MESYKFPQISLLFSVLMVFFFQICQIELPASTRFEEMIHDPGFMAKTHYFAQRLEELRKLHQFYRNLAKQAPRRNQSLSQLPNNGAVLPDLLVRPTEDDSTTDPKDIIESCLLPHPVYDQEQPLTSLSMEPEYNFDWKSLLPEEIEVISEAGDCRADGDDSASDFSKDLSENVYDIQSDIMPYLPSNYVSLSSLTAHRPPDLIMTGNLRYTASLQPPENKYEERKPSPIAEDPVDDDTHNNITSLSDDEGNVKQAKVKKDKKKKKIGVINSSKKTTKENSDIEASSGFSKISWSKFFTGRRNSAPKESPKKSSKNSSKSGSRERDLSTTGRTVEKSNRKTKEKDFDKKVREHDLSREEQRSPRELRQSREGDGSKLIKQSSKTESDKSRSKSTRKNTEHRTGTSNGSASGRSSRRESSRESNRSNNSKQDLSGKGKCSVFQRENLSVHSGNASGSNSSTYHGYDSGADSGVGLKVDTVDYFYLARM